MKNFIGLETEKANTISSKLNELLANYQLFYQNLRGFHWNIKGENFFELHLKFEELYNEANVAVDEIAERILTLQGQPLHSFTQYLNHASIKESVDVKNGRLAVEVIVANYGVLISLEREILELAGDTNDEGTNSLMSDYIVASEKTVWMLNSYLS
ncbi:MAG: Dps family protein [Salibacteraceae bacterium]